jgi:hypothetical protein
VEALLPIYIIEIDCVPLPAEADSISTCFACVMLVIFTPVLLYPKQYPAHSTPISQFKS